MPLAGLLLDRVYGGCRLSSAISRRHQIPAPNILLHLPDLITGSPSLSVQPSPRSSQQGFPNPMPALVTHRQQHQVPSGQPNRPRSLAKIGGSSEVFVKHR